MQIGKKETTNPFGKTSEVGYFKLQNDGYLALNNTTTGIFSIYLKCTSTGTINIGSDERTISTVWMRYIFYKIPLNCQVLFTQGEYFIYGAKLESGNKVTDWTAAPEDIQNQFTIITNTISGVSSKVDNVEKSIVNKVWQTDITSRINEYNNTTVKEIVDRVTKTETDINGVTTTVSTMKTNYDGQITSLETKQIQTDSKLGWLVSSGTSSSDFTLTDRTAELVSKYINLHGLVTFKGLSSDVNGKFTKYDGWGGATDSTKINGAMVETGSIKAEQIAANAITAIKIAANAVTADKISAYGLSVLHKTTGVKTLEIDASGNVNLNVNSLQIASKDVPTKTEVIQSIKDLQIGGRNLLLNSADLTKWDTSDGPTVADADGYFKVTYPGSSSWWGAKLMVSLTAGQTYTLSGWCKGTDAKLYAYSPSESYNTATNSTEAGKFLSVTFVPKTSHSFYIICYATPKSINYYKWPKLEKGNKATDWTPAPEDLQDDATTKANNALASAKTYADAQIKVTADSINQNVTKKFDGLQIGGRNYAVGTSNKWSEYWIPSTGVNICRYVTKIVVPDTFKKGDVFTTSIEIEWSGFKSSEGTFRLWTQGSQDGTWDKINPFTEKLADIRTESGSQLFKVTNTWDGKATNYYVGFRCDYSSGTGKIRWRRLKAEAGNKATDWSPAPEDLATADNVNDKLTELRQEVNSNIEQTGEAIKSSVYEKVYMKDDVDTLLSSVNTEVEQTKTSWQVTFNQLVKQLNDYSDGSDAAFDEIRKYIRFEDGNILLGNSSSPLILRIRNDRIQFLQNGYEVAYISDQRMYNTTCEIINQLRIADSAWTVEYNASGDTVISLVGI